MDNGAYVLLDIKGLILHSLHAGEDPDGQLDPETNKVENSAGFGFANFFDRYLLPILEVAPPRKIIAVWEGGNSYRRGMFPGYKLKRSQKEYTDYAAEQHSSLENSVKSFLAYLGVNSCMVPGAEADDVLAYLDSKLPGMKIVYTCDKDMFQLISPSTTVMYRTEGAVDPLEVKPVTIAVEKSLLGDTSDEYPGIKGFGPAKLEAILAEFGEDTLLDLDRVVREQTFEDVKDAAEAATDTQARQGLNLIYENRDSWPLQYTLACLHPELCEGRNTDKFNKLKWYKRVPDEERLSAILNYFGMGNDLERLRPILPVTTLVTADNKEEFEQHFLDHLDETPFFAFDYESYDVLKHEPFQQAKKSGVHVDVLSQSITGVSINYGESLQYTAYISVDHHDTNNLEDLYIKDILETIEETGTPLVAHNAPFEHALTDTNLLMPLSRPLHDTRLMALYVAEADGGHLKNLSKSWLNYDQVSYADVLKMAGVDDMHEATGKQVLHYGADDSIVAAHLYDLFKLILVIERTWQFVRDEEFPTNCVLYEGFESGINIDYARLDELAEEDAKEYEAGFEKCRSMLAEHCGQPNTAKAIELISELTDFEAARLKSLDKPKDEIDAKLEQMKDKLEAATQYLPMVTTKQEVKFTPTALRITKIANMLGINKELTGVTPNKITEFMMGINATLDPDGNQWSDEAVIFLDLLGRASEELKKREGDSFQALYDFCISLLTEDSPDEVHGDELSMDSPKQMQQLFYCKLGLPIRVRSKVQHGSKRDELDFEGAPSTDKKAIEFALSADAVEGDWRREFLMTWRDINACHTRKKMYWVPYPLWKHPRDGMIHGGISNAATVTHRFTGSDPNLLQIPARDGGRVRSMILPREEGHVILSPDFNGEELRIAASLSKDPVMLDAYLGETKRDLHTITAAAISGAVIRRERPDLMEKLVFTGVNGLVTLPYLTFKGMLEGEDESVAKLCKNIRTLAKNVNFLLVYAGKAGTLARNLGIPYDDAEQFLNATLNVFTEIIPWQEESIEFARTHGYVLTSYGNRRHLGDGLFSTDNAVRMRLERQAINSQVQGTGSDIMKVVMHSMYRTRLLEAMYGHLLVAPYDEVAVSVPRSAAWECWCRMKEMMTLTPPGHAVPQLPELKASALNWGTCVELGAHPTEDQLDELFDKQLAERRAA